MLPGNPAFKLRSIEAPAVAVVRSGSVSGWRALVLAYVEGIPRLLVVSEGHGFDAPSDIIGSLPDFEGTDTSDHRSLPAVRRCIAAWFSSQRAAAMTRPVEHAASPAHARALRALASLERSLPRSDRLREAQRIARTRHLLLQQRGAGAERALAQLAPLLQLKSATRTAHQLLDALEVAAQIDPQSNACSEGEPILACVLVATPR